MKSGAIEMNYQTSNIPALSEKSSGVSEKLISLGATPYDFDLIKLPVSPRGKRILFVCDRIALAGDDKFDKNAVITDPNERILMSRSQQQVFKNCIDYCISQTDDPIAECQIINFPYFHIQDRALYEKTRYMFVKRLFRAIDKYKPDCTVIMGVDAFVQTMRYTHPDASSKIDYRNRLNRIMKVRNNERSYAIVGTVSLSDIATQDKEKMNTFPNLIGYWCKGVITAMNGYNDYTINIKDRKIVNIDTIAKFKKFYEQLFQCKRVAIDTETKNLLRRNNVLYTMQFSFDGKTAYFLPLFHAQTPFSARELEYICKKLRHYFEFGESDYHIYQNAQFDITVLKIAKRSLGIRHYNHRIYDTIAGEYCLDENRKFLIGYGIKPYKLDFLTHQYGCTVYDELNFSKEDRGNMATTELTDDLIDYASVDALVTYQIARFQRIEARRREYDGFMFLMLYQFDHMIKAFSHAEYTGILIDRRYLFHLMSAESPVRKKMAEVMNELKALPSVRRANEILLNKAGIPVGGGLFGNVSWIFEITKPASKQALFFNVLNLSPISKQKDGVSGKVDKRFQEAYKDVLEVKLFNTYSKLRTLRDTFIGDAKKGIYGILKNNEDTKADNRLRPFFDFKDVVTGRSSARKPNLQNIATHGDLAKFLKRLFIAGPGNIIVKLDYSAHEVRMWGNISGDLAIAGAFIAAMALRLQYRLKPSTYLKNEVEDKGDIHKFNFKFFFGRPPKDKPERNSIKTVVFGVMYGKGAESLGVEMQEKGGLPHGVNDATAFAQSLIDKLFERFEKGGNFINRTIARARKTFIATSPIMRIRHLWGYLHNRTGVHNAMSRRGPNSIIQGLASDILLTAVTILNDMRWNFFIKHDIEFEAAPNNYVHDSIESEVPVHLVPIYIYLAEHATTTLVHRQYRRVFKFQMAVGLEIEFSFGGSQDNMEDWDWNVYSEDVIVKDKPSRNLVNIIEDQIQYMRTLHPDYWTDTTIRRTMKVFHHNLKIVHKIRSAEMRQVLKENANPSEIMHMNEQNVLDYGFIFEVKEKVHA